MCSYPSPESLFPQLELLYLGGIAREWKNAQVEYVDAIAEEIGSEEVDNRIEHFLPDMIVTITGFECFEEDINEINRLKERFPNTTLIAFGHYPTHFADEILPKARMDYLMLGEPDLVYSDLYDALQGDKPLSDINGIAYRDENSEVVMQGRDSRIPDPNVLPMPAYDLMPYDKYFEPMLARPYAMMQTARGCPYQCTFCVKSFGTKLTTMTPERILEEIRFLKEHHHIKSLRFIDDTFTINKKRIIKLCKMMVDHNVDIEWTCLSRTDNLQDDLLYWMSKAGCKRIYFGLESGSQRILDAYKKGIKVEEAIENLKMCKKHGIETVGFFMSGYPEETEEDFEKSIDFAIRADLTYASFNPITPYPGTALFEELRDHVAFSILPYKNEFKNAREINQTFARRKKEFYRRFYLRPSYMLPMSAKLVTNFRETFSNGVSLLSYLWFNGKFTISGLKGAYDE